MTSTSPLRARVRRGPPLAFRIVAVLCGALFFGIEEAPLPQAHGTLASIGRSCAGASPDLGAPVRIQLIVDRTGSVVEHVVRIPESGGAPAWRRCR